MVEMLAYQLEAKMRVGGIQVEAAAIEFLDRFFQLAARRLAAVPRVLLDRWFGHSVHTPHLWRATPGALARNANIRRTRPRLAAAY
jgi:hypothetical protein